MPTVYKNNSVLRKFWTFNPGTTESLIRFLGELIALYSISKMLLDM